MRDALLLRHRDELYRLIVSGEEGAFSVRDENGVSVALSFFALGDGVAEVRFDDRRELVHYAVAGDAVYVQFRGDTITYRHERHERSAGHEPGASDDLRAPMPGQVTTIFVSVGQRVEAGAPLYAIEAMKMESLVRAPGPGRVAALHAKRGEQVDGGALVVELEALEAPVGELVKTGSDDRSAARP